jgi:hypothetical protein
MPRMRLVLERYQYHIINAMWTVTLERKYAPLVIILVKTVLKNCVIRCPFYIGKIVLSSSTIPKKYSCSIDPSIIFFTQENYYYLIIWYVQKNIHTPPTIVYYTAFFYSTIGKIYLLHHSLPIYCIILRYLTLVKMGLKKLHSSLSLLYRKNTTGKI